MLREMQPLANSTITLSKICFSNEAKLFEKSLHQFLVIVKLQYDMLELYQLHKISLFQQFRLNST